MEEPPRILVVDDEPRSLELLVRTLRDLGRVETALSAERAWELAWVAPLDLVISDQRMPGMSGVELLERIAERDEQVGRVLLTGYTDLGATVDAINRSRVHAYVAKPWTPEQLRLTVQALLEQVRLARENERLVADLAAKNRELEETMDALRDAQQRVVESERLSAIGRMIAMIVHDFRGPLSVLRSTSTQILSGPELAADEVRELAGVLREEAERMTGMCTDLLETTRASGPGLDRTEEDVDDLVGHAVALIATDAAQSAVTVETDLTAGARVRLDPDRLRRALLNLAYNAIEAMPEGGVLRVVTSATESEVEISVADTGVGIPEEIRDRMFEPFVTAGKRGGSGLGLAIVKKIVDDHSGRVEVGKPEGGGTAFHVRLPREA